VTSDALSISCEPGSSDAALQGTIAADKDISFTAYPVRCHSGKEPDAKIRDHVSSFLGGCRANLMGRVARNCRLFGQIAPFDFLHLAIDPRRGHQRGRPDPPEPTSVGNCNHRLAPTSIDLVSSAAVSRCDCNARRVLACTTSPGVRRQDAERPRLLQIGQLTYCCQSVCDGSLTHAIDRALAVGGRSRGGPNASAGGVQ